MVLRVHLDRFWIHDSFVDEMPKRVQSTFLLIQLLVQAPIGFHQTSVSTIKKLFGLKHQWLHAKRMKTDSIKLHWLKFFPIWLISFLYQQHFFFFSVWAWVWLFAESFTVWDVYCVVVFCLLFVLVFAEELVGLFLTKPLFIV